MEGEVSAAARKALSAADPVMADLIERIGKLAVEETPLKLTTAQTGGRAAQRSARGAGARPAPPRRRRAAERRRQRSCSKRARRTCAAPASPDARSNTFV